MVESVLLDCPLEFHFYAFYRIRARIPSIDDMYFTNRMYDLYWKVQSKMKLVSFLLSPIIATFDMY